MSATIDALLSGDNPAADPGAKKIFTVGQYNRGIERRMKEIPATWVKGVITQLQVRGKAVYVTLAEFDEGDARPKATLDVILWAGQYEAYNARFALLPTPFTLRAELKVSFLLEAAFYVPSGRFQTKVLDIDEAFTLGELALTRQKILDTLKREGLLERNKQLPFPAVPLRIGLVSARGSAAYQDFTTVLMQSGFSFEIFFAEARMQGPATESTVTAAIALLSGRALDVICVVRGGGSKTDLVFFDSEAICRAIATCPVPVLTGIGHEIDRSLADIVAHADLLTPTDCAKHLESRLQIVWQRLADHASTVREAWETAYVEQGFENMQRAEKLRSSWEARSQREAQHFAEAAKGLMRGPGKLARLERLRFLNKSARIGHLWESRYRQESLRQVNTQEGLADAGLRFLAAAREKLSLARVGLARGPDKHLRHAVEALALKDRLLRASDPVSLMKRGFSLVLTPDRKLVRSIADVADGQEIRIRFADGEAAAKIQHKIQHKVLKEKT